MRKFVSLGIALLVSFAIIGCEQGPKVRYDEGNQQLHVMMGEDHFTTYLYDSNLMKPVLWPVHSVSGLRMQRGFPVNENEGETTDHRHHNGIFFTYGSDDEVNGNSYWSFHQKPPNIRHMEFLTQEGTQGEGTVKARLEWVGSDNSVVLEEYRTMVFSQTDNMRTIDFTFRLTPPDTAVTFGDTKEGMFAIRVADWLSEEHGNGEFLNSEGERTEENVWGKRAKWMRLESTRNDTTSAGIAIMNHPSSVNYPTFWHARGYGLFAANPLGQYVFQNTRGVENPDSLNFTIAQGDTADFKFKMLIYEGSMTAEDIENEFQNYAP